MGAQYPDPEDAGTGHVQSLVCSGYVQLHLTVSKLKPFNVVLYEPEIPPNTGNIIRLCANTGAQLHLIEPLGFAWDNSRLKRAGLDYHDLTHVTLYKSFAEYRQAVQPARLFACTTKGSARYHEPAYPAGDTFVFGPETRGLPDFVLNHTLTPSIRIPMKPGSRSLNLSNTAAIVLYHALGELGFAGLN